MLLCAINLENILREHIHILGICGTFMGSLALLARQLGYQVTGSDTQVYPPMSTQLERAGIEIHEGYRVQHLQPRPDRVIIGNALSRGNEAVEYVLRERIPYTSGPQWLGEHVLRNRSVIAVAGTHGKTTTSSLLAWILTFAGHKPGYLIGGVPANLPFSADLGEGECFVIEADEYDTAFFDKRSKFVHYHPTALVIGNLEYDHADIFPDLEAIETQFHHVIRCVPDNGVILAREGDAISRVLDRGCWSPLQRLGGEGGWRTEPVSADGTVFRLRSPEGEAVTISWPLLGEHNCANALAAVAAAATAGVSLVVAAEALAEFRGVKRRLELRGVPGGVAVYDDFAHHPTAIKTTLHALRAQMTASQPAGRLIAVIEPRSNTMRLGVHQATLAAATAEADAVFWYQPPGIDWSFTSVLTGQDRFRHSQISELVTAVAQYAQCGDRVVIMSNGGFDGVHGKLLAALEACDQD